MPWVRGIIFTVLVPGIVAGYVPLRLLRDAPLAAGPWCLGWILVALGAALYGSCLASFLAGSGTPAPFFLSHLRFLIGEEPSHLVRRGMYRYSRNPMYLGVLTTIFGEAVIYRSRPVAIYGALAALTFHLVVILIEEPHWRKKDRAAYDEYTRRVPRWFGTIR